MEKALATIASLMRRAGTDDRCFPPTLLFEEGWMLRLVVQWFQQSGVAGHDLSFAPDAGWFSEARLASAFLPRYRGDKHAESHTHADAAIGHFDIGERGLADLSLRKNARQFLVVEAKMFSGLAAGTKRAPGFNQAARNVACMAELIGHAKLDPQSFTSLAFFVVAPKEQIDAGLFSRFMERAALERVVRARATSYDPPKSEWFEDCFLPVFRAMQIGCIAWEDLVSFIKSADASFGQDLEAFYRQCLTFNRADKNTDNGTGRA